jgi:hypothetical protein
MRKLVLTAFCLALGACVSGGDIVQDTTRSLARTAVNAAAGKYVPGVNVTPYTDCVINNASTGELLQLAQAAGAGAAQEIATAAYPTVKTIAGRSDTAKCFLSTLSAADLLATQGLDLGGL